MTKRYRFKCDKNRESFQRWSDHRIEQLTAANALIFALSSAALGYASTLISDDKTPVEKLSTWPFVLFVGSFFISFVFGILVVFNRFKSFRETCDIIKLRDAKEDASKDVDALRDENDKTDSWTWASFKIQVASFFCGGIVFFLYVVNSNIDRVYFILKHL